MQFINFYLLNLKAFAVIVIISKYNMLEGQVQIIPTLCKLVAYTRKETQKE